MLVDLATVKRETNSWRYPIIMAAYLFALAYAGSWITYRIAMALRGMETHERHLDNSLVGLRCCSAWDTPWHRWGRAALESGCFRP